jgi:glycine/D-amino acid oxidase-like deaminating enzyme
MHISNPLLCDVLVIGSGASGLATAVTAAELGLDVIVVEKEPQLGGTSAWSGGWLWIPRNPLAIADGIVEDPEQARIYLRQELHNEALDACRDVPRTRAEDGRIFPAPYRGAVFLRQQNAGLSRQRRPRQRRRSVCAQPFDGRRLGPWINAATPARPHQPVWNGHRRRHRPQSFPQCPALAVFAALQRQAVLRHTRDLLRHGRGMHLVNGNALVARLLKSAVDRQVRLFTETPVRTLLREGDRVVGRVLNPQGNGSMFAPGEVSCWLVVASPTISGASRSCSSTRPMAPNI